MDLKIVFKHGSEQLNSITLEWYMSKDDHLGPYTKNAKPLSRVRTHFLMFQ